MPTKVPPLLKKISKASRVSPTTIYDLAIVLAINLNENSNDQKKIREKGISKKTQ